MGFSIEKVLLLMLLAALLIGPEKLPRLASGLGALVRRVRLFADDTKTRLKEEMGEDFDDIDWRDLDPRQYDPRRIIREALTEPLPEREPGSTTTDPVAVAAAPLAMDGLGSGPARPGSGEEFPDDSPHTGAVSGDPGGAIRFDDQAT